MEMSKDSRNGSLKFKTKLERSSLMGFSHQVKIQGIVQNGGIHIYTCKFVQLRNTGYYSMGFKFSRV